MALREMILMPDPILRKKAHRITEFDDKLQVLIDDMIETMRSAPGVGLAAPQVNESIQLIVVEYGDDDDEEAPKKLYVVINPEIVKTSLEKETGVEACLSVPGLAGEVDRYLSVVVKGQNRRGQAIKIKASDWLARIFQHEIDHLSGILFVDIANKIWKLSEEELEEIAD